MYPWRTAALLLLLACCGGVDAANSTPARGVDGPIATAATTHTKNPKAILSTSSAQTGVASTRTPTAKSTRPPFTTPPAPAPTGVAATRTPIAARSDAGSIAALIAAAGADGVDGIFGMASIDRLASVHYAAPAFHNSNCIRDPSTEIPEIGCGDLFFVNHGQHDYDTYTKNECTNAVGALNKLPNVSGVECQEGGLFDESQFALPTAGECLVVAAALNRLLDIDITPNSTSPYATYIDCGWRGNATIIPGCIGRDWCRCDDIADRLTKVMQAKEAAPARKEYAATDWVLNPVEPNMGKPQGPCLGNIRQGKATEERNNIPGQGRTETSSYMECASRCALVEGCAYWTWVGDGGCDLSKEGAWRIDADIDHITGDCTKPAAAAADSAAADPAARITTDDTRGYPTITWPCTAGEAFTLVVFDAGTAASMSTQNNTGEGYSGVTHGIIPNIPCDATTAIATAGSLQKGGDVDDDGSGDGGGSGDISSGGGEGGGGSGGSGSNSEHFPALPSSNASYTPSGGGNYKYFNPGNPEVAVHYYNYFVFLQPAAPAAPQVWEWNASFIDFHPKVFAAAYKLGAPVAHTWVRASVGVTSFYTLNALGVPAYAANACNALKGIGAAGTTTTTTTTATTSIAGGGNATTTTTTTTDGGGGGGGGGDTTTSTATTATTSIAGGGNATTTTTLPTPTPTSTSASTAAITTTPPAGAASTKKKTKMLIIYAAAGGGGGLLLLSLLLFCCCCKNACRHSGPKYDMFNGGAAVFHMPDQIYQDEDL